MKIKSLLLNVCLCCLAVLVLVGACAPVFQFRVQAMNIRPANNNDGVLYGTELFDAEGNYTLDFAGLKEAQETFKVFNFFGYNWRIVDINADQGVATFWMVDPYTSSIFNAVKRSGTEIYYENSNIWANGYNNTIWHSTERSDINLGASAIHQLLADKSEEILNNSAYKHYVNKIKKGAVIGSNEVNTQTLIENFTYAADDLQNVTQKNNKSKEITAEYGLGTDSVLWLPSEAELKEIWEVPSEVLSWLDTTNNGGCAWLRTPNEEYNHLGVVVCSELQEDTETGRTSWYMNKAIKQEAGVRPAIHLNIGEISPIETEKKWFNEDWLKVLFIVVCVLGILGIALVTTAVVVKSRKKRAA